MGDRVDGYYWVKWACDIQQGWDVMEYHNGDWEYHHDGVTDDDFSVIGARIPEPLDD